MASPSPNREIPVAMPILTLPIGLGCRPDSFRLTLLERVSRKSHLTKANTSRMIVGLALEKKIKLAEVTKFYQEVWSNLSFESGQRFSQLRLDWTPEENAFATHLRKECPQFK
jgi:hypothetical protein